MKVVCIDNFSYHELNNKNDLKVGHIYDVENYKNEKERYTEQTVYGNLYNAEIEFLMANNFINKLVESNETAELNNIKQGLENTFDETINYIKSEGRKKVRREKLKKIND